MCVDPCAMSYRNLHLRNVFKFWWGRLLNLVAVLDFFLIHQFSVTVMKCLTRSYAKGMGLFQFTDLPVPSKIKKSLLSVLVFCFHQDLSKMLRLSKWESQGSKMHTLDLLENPKSLKRKEQRTFFFNVTQKQRNPKSQKERSEKGV